MISPSRPDGYIATHVHEYFAGRPQFARRLVDESHQYARLLA
jgi:hypothetical protein